jgi:hypothetical protein
MVYFLQVSPAELCYIPRQLNSPLFDHNSSQYCQIRPLIEGPEPFVFIQGRRKANSLIRLMNLFDIIHTVVLIQYIYLLEISIIHNNYCGSYSLNIRTTCLGLNRPSSGLQDLNLYYATYVSIPRWDPILNCSVHNCFKTEDKEY